MREVSKQGSWGKGNIILVGTNIMYIKLSDDKVEEGKIFDFIDKQSSYKTHFNRGSLV